MKCGHLGKEIEYLQRLCNEEIRERRQESNFQQDQFLPY
jgi:hypothetical protein